MSAILPDRLSPHNPLASRAATLLAGTAMAMLATALQAVPMRLAAGFARRTRTPARPGALAQRVPPAPVEQAGLTLPLRGPCRIAAATASGGSGHPGLLLYPLAEDLITVRAPCAGTIIESVDGFADSGNRLVLRRDDGGYVRLASLRQGGINVRAGDRVAPGAALATGAAGRPILLRCQEGLDAASPGRPFRFAGAAQLGNGGPRWVFAAEPVPGQELDAADDDVDVLAALTLLCPAVARFDVEARGAAAVRFLGAAAPVATLTADGFARGVIALRDEGGATLMGAADAHAWRASLQGRPGALLRCLALGLAVVPLSRLPGMWWCETVRVPAGRDGLAAFLAPRRSARCFGSFAEAGMDIVVRTSVRSADTSLPERIDIAVTPDHGVVAVRACFADGWLHFIRPGFEAAMA